MKARGAISDGKGGFVIDDFELGEPGPNEVLVEIHASGVCHTDHKILPRGQVLVMGHEGAGIIRSIGTNVRNVKVGDRVLLNWAMPCRECFSCRNGLQNVCENKPRVPDERFRYRGQPINTSFQLGTMATATIVPEPAVVRLDVDISFQAACILGCCVMTGYGSVFNVAKVPRGSSVAVIGCGAVGLCTIQSARIAGAEKIIAIDINPTKLEAAMRMGATNAVLAERADDGLLRAGREVKRLTSGRGADYAFEATSVPALGAAPLAMVRNGGMALQLSGIEEKVSIDMELFEWDKIYINPLYGKCDPPRDFPKLLQHYARKELLLEEMITGVYALDDLPRAFEDMLAGVNTKAVLKIQ